MHRSFDPEILDGDGIPDAVVERTHRHLLRTHKLLGNISSLVHRVRQDPLPIKRVLDVGCGHGGILLQVQQRLGVEAVGVDLKPPARLSRPFPILRADAARDPLPEADVAICVCLAHHLPEDELVEMIRNVGRSCRRFVILDLVRNRVPLTLFKTFAPLFVSRLNVSDGCQSIRRAYTPAELRTAIHRALSGTSGRFHHSVAPLGIRQIVDISYQQ
jgi:SAM-dependent methyltransferase